MLARQWALGVCQRGNGSTASSHLRDRLSPPHRLFGRTWPRGPTATLRREAPSRKPFVGLISPGRFELEGFAIGARAVPHPGGRTFGYRVSDGHCATTYVPDQCSTELGPGPDGEYHEAVLELAREADVLVHDAHVCPRSSPAEAAFGHAAADHAVGLARAAGARRAVLFHHKPDRNDGALDALARRFEGAPVTVTVTVASEATVLRL
jgi:hypothetical protein